MKTMSRYEKQPGAFTIAPEALDKVVLLVVSLQGNARRFAPLAL